jgi:hypothetical protein
MRSYICTFLQLHMNELNRILFVSSYKEKEEHNSLSWGCPWIIHHSTRHPPHGGCEDWDVDKKNLKRQQEKKKLEPLWKGRGRTYQLVCYSGNVDRGLTSSRQGRPYNSRRKRQEEGVGMWRWGSGSVGMVYWGTASRGWSEQWGKCSMLIYTSKQHSEG